MTEDRSATSEIRSPLTEDRSASFVELFFDLVFVFGITQVVASIHGHLDWPTLWRAAVVLALLWWAWSQFTWLAGQADFDELRPRLVLLAATAGTFVLAVAVQGAWGDDGLSFGAGYFGVMVLAGVFGLVHATRESAAGMLAYIPRMLAGATLVLIGGFFEGDARTWLWIGAVVVNLVSALAAGRYQFTLNPAHFAERHGLFVIIVLGEALIAIGLGTVDHPGTADFYVAGTAMIVMVLAMWWSYFDWLFPIGERSLKQASGTALGRLARDAYTVGHYPLVAGVILFAVGTEELLAHPEAALDAGARWAFFGGLAAFLGAQALMTLRLTGHMAWERFSVVVVLLGAAAVLGTVSGAVLAFIALAIVLAGLVVEAARHWEQLGALR
ncbi:MAG: low temperature requirement protein A [Acidimicrobiia bacterium]|nr:low temperature requirement protein A [Acidimicrobiia bacterium]